MASNEEQNGDEDQETQTRWMRLREKTRRDFNEINDRNQKEIVDTKMRIAEYVSTCLQSSDGPRAEESGLGGGWMMSSLSQFAHRVRQIVKNANDEFQASVDDVKMDITRRVHDAGAKEGRWQEAEARSQAEMGAILTSQLNVLKQTVQQSFFDVNEETRRCIDEAKLKIGRSVMDIAAAAVKDNQNND